MIVSRGLLTQEQWRALEDLGYLDRSTFIIDCSLDDAALCWKFSPPPCRECSAEAKVCLCAKFVSNNENRHLSKQRKRILVMQLCALLCFLMM